ncbi:hypothetical protein [Curtobacterium flaccumfaciens]|uniref:hypothetical protein n=1 Tax=Curtobacterium flaccumfaciens TaxID=2035 RepID=UPI000FFE4C46|nr:hypothetical protein [Curtobacterium flaccumfaciens]MCS0646868.1 hypothetical protein [Curtobacterium flaccumfaciens pv. flaccumfaciens]MCS6524463.1 hypothetical protein [Curtobacterium flaccumfaciens pv. flaccumfaciens]MCS6529609.1 hypothetical protein [Curtobacterium flaccumfaciens pv. flaccumfaciens]NUU11060.1 hypothetical protein [Curtobacterium flaccumfaciens]RXF84545.1 hypothetical protein CffCFBP3418_05450 [Curtobacterium flaccumfaciens pv. flaccumfaciens]
MPASRGAGSNTQTAPTRVPSRSSNADGHADDQSTARARAVDGLELAAGTTSCRRTRRAHPRHGNITVRAVARSTEIRPHEASGPNYAAALKAYLESISDGWISLGTTVDA